MVRVSVLVSQCHFFFFFLLDVNMFLFFFFPLQNDCLNNIVNAERRGKRQVLIRPSSKVVVKFLSVMQRHGKQSILRSPGETISFFSLTFCFSFTDVSS